ncbi:D-2-hydroxyacid dehydrogenase [Glaciihabitans sp. dw_435]|uniref:D-2-hydroxyacid dehydrogenase n=1 Tax=Glaciihabitans sp. dw_435 TaxID=2720081 RepID=UPI001BD5010C|nr:D-2-hydroxyacid dehydrogenase [Glaciihabitans sp. dw_435]
MNTQLRLVIASPLSEELCRFIEQREPRVEVVRDHSLLPTQMYGGDHHGDPSFTRTPAQDARLHELMNSADALYGLPAESSFALADVVASNPGLRWVHTTAAGGGAQVKAAHLPADALERIAFTQSGGVHAEPLAEFALFGLLAGLKDLPRLEAAKARGEWIPRWNMGIMADQTVVVVGLGGIGRAVARKFSLLGARVIGVHRRQVDAPGVERIVGVEELADVAGSADAIVLALPGTSATEKMLSRDVLARVKPGIIVVNVGRGNTVDEDALIEALGDGRVGFAALDVVAVEPLAGDSPLWTLPNVLISPHTSALHPGEDRLISEIVAENATRLIEGRPLINRVNTVEFY